MLDPSALLPTIPISPDLVEVDEPRVGSGLRIRLRNPLSPTATALPKVMHDAGTIRTFLQKVESHHRHLLVDDISCLPFIFEQTADQKPVSDHLPLSFERWNNMNTIAIHIVMPSDAQLYNLKSARDYHYQSKFRDVLLAVKKFEHRPSGLCRPIFYYYSPDCCHDGDFIHVLNGPIARQACIDVGIASLEEVLGVETCTIR